MIRHLVCLRYRAGTPDDRKAALMAELKGLTGRIDGILDFQVRANVSVEDEMVRGYRDLFWFDFRDAAVRDAYLVDAEHRAIGGQLVAELEGGRDGVFVADFEV